jgi:hypothetical protein
MRRCARPQRLPYKIRAAHVGDWHHGLYHPGSDAMSQRQKHPDPTPEEIAERCAEIQQTWPENEDGTRKIRTVNNQRPTDPEPRQTSWEPPVISTRDLEE